MNATQTPSKTTTPPPKTGTAAGTNGEEGPKFGEIVTYTEHEVEYAATVLQNRGKLEVEGQPTPKDDFLHLGFFQPQFKHDFDRGRMVPLNVIGTSNENSLAQYRLDVANESIDASAEEPSHPTTPPPAPGQAPPTPPKPDQGPPAPPKPAPYPGGRWKAGAPAEPPKIDDIMRAMYPAEAAAEASAAKKLLDTLQLAQDALKAQGEKKKGHDTHGTQSKPPSTTPSAQPQGKVY